MVTKMSDYYLSFDETGQPYISHGLIFNRREGSKYISKVQDGNKIRYFYSKEDLEKYRNDAKKSIEGIKTKRQNYRAAKKAYRDLKKQGKNLSKDNDKEINKINKELSDLGTKWQRTMESSRKVKSDNNNGRISAPTDLYRVATSDKLRNKINNKTNERDKALADRQAEIDNYNKRLALAQRQIEKSKNDLISSKEFARKSNLDYVEAWLSRPFSEEVTINVLNMSSSSAKNKNTGGGR